jgi:hypothetical protein
MGRENGGALPIERKDVSATWRSKLDLTTIVALSALVLSVLSFYVSYIYTNQQLDVTVTEVAYMTNQGELYMTVAFSNAGNPDAALLRVEPAYWGRRASANLEWIPLSEKVHAEIPVTVPKTPMVVKAGGVELVTLSAKLARGVAEQTDASSQGGAYVGVRVATMNSDGNLYLLQHSVARLVLDAQGRIRGAEPTIHRSLSGFVDIAGAPPGDMLQSNKKTPFVWADSES